MTRTGRSRAGDRRSGSRNSPASVQFPLPPSSASIPRFSSSITPREVRRPGGRDGHGKGKTPIPEGTQLSGRALIPYPAHLPTSSSRAGANLCPRRDPIPLESQHPYSRLVRVLHRFSRLSRLRVVLSDHLLEERVVVLATSFLLFDKHPGFTRARDPARVCV